MTQKKKVVGVVFGGRSPEHEISLRSAVFILNNIPSQFNILPIGIKKDGSWVSTTTVKNKSSFEKATVKDLEKFLKKETSVIASKTSIRDACCLPVPVNAIPKSSKFLKILNLDVDVFFPVLHGVNGEDGTIQSLFELAELPYVGNSVRSSVLGIDKDFQKRLVAQDGVRIANYRGLEYQEWNKDQSKMIDHIIKEVGFPCFVKPNAQGSAVGTGPAETRAQLMQRINEAFKFDQRVLVEESLKGGEFECAFIGNFIDGFITRPGEIAPTGFYSYEEKYSSTSTSQVFIPARLEQNQMDELIESCRVIARSLRLDGLCRIDFLKDPVKQEFVFNEINTIPGMTSISLYPKAMESEKISHAKWIKQAITDGINRNKLQRKRITSLG